MVSAEHAGAVLTVDLGAIADNYRLLKQTAGNAECAAVVKADAYGLGAAAVAEALAVAGCTTFFVAQAEEGAALRGALAGTGADHTICVLNGYQPDNDDLHREFNLVPVLNTTGEVADWGRRTDGGDAKAVLHADTGMSRLGMAVAEITALAAEPSGLAGVDVAWVMSHLASAYDRGDPMNGDQLAAFNTVRAAFPGVAASFANSSGIFLGPEYHFDMVRPGAALFGLAPIKDEPNPMSQVIRLQGKILQLRYVDSNMTVGYGATHRFTRPGRLATVAVGYADGYLRSLSNHGSGYIGGVRVPVVGRVSMDLITFDVTDVPEDQCQPGQSIDLISDQHGPDALGTQAGTIGYEILTALGKRYHRRYVGAPARRSARG